MATITKTISVATSGAATATVPGTPGVIQTAAFNDTTSANMAVTPAGLSAVLATSASGMESTLLDVNDANVVQTNANWTVSNPYPGYFVNIKIFLSTSYSPDMYTYTEIPNGLFAEYFIATGGRSFGTKAYLDLGGGTNVIRVISGQSYIAPMYYKSATSSVFLTQGYIRLLVTKLGKAPV